MANTLEMAKIFQTQLDKQILQDATSNFLEVNAGQVIYHGGDTVKIPTIATQGMGNYDRNKGYTQGSVTLTYKDYTLTQDRGRSFNLDAMDIDESNFLASAGNVLGEFQRTQVIPEIDSYRWSKVHQLAKGAGNATTYTVDSSTIIKNLKSDITKVEDVVGNHNGLVLIMNTYAAAALDEALPKQLDPATFTAGSISDEVKSYDGIPIIKVSSARMMSDYTINDGSTTGQEAGGLVETSAATQVNWLIFPQTAPIAVSKTDTIRIFDPMQYQAANAWHIDYRKFHDLWIPSNKLATVFTNYVAAKA
jgi:hypothetical protein